MKKGAIIGFGGQGKQLFIAMNTAGIEVVAACDIQPGAFSTEPPVDKKSWTAGFPQLAEYQSLPPKVYNDPKKLFEENPALDVVCVATWTESRGLITIAAAESGVKAILCEEPMAICLADSQKMIDVCKEKGVLLTIHHTRRWWPAHRKVKELIDAGKIGKLRSIYISCGGARMGMLGTHWIDFTRWITDAEGDFVTGWLDEITENEPRGPQFRDPPGQVQITLRNGVKAFIEQGAGIALPPHYVICGTKGRIFNTQYQSPEPRESWEIWSLKNPDVSAVRQYMGEMQGGELAVPQAINWRNQGVEALQELLEGRTSCDGEDGYKTLEVLIATYISHQEGIPIRLPLTNPDHLQYRLQNA